MRLSHLALAVSLLSVVECSKPADSFSSSGIPVYAYQDLPLSYSIGSTAAGTYAIDNLPSWASFDTSTGVLSGTPTKTADSFSFTVTQTQGSTTTQFGPYDVSFVGNPLKEYQWHLKNTGQTAFSLKTGTAGEDMHLSNSLASGLTGNGVTIAISDSGVLLTHEALKDNALTTLSRNYLNNYTVTQSWLGNPAPDQSDPDNAHGTAVASLAAESGWNGLGGRGVAPDAKIAGFLFIQAQDQLTTEGLYTQALNDQFAGPFDIFNYSWGDAQCELVSYGATTFAKMQAGVTSQRGMHGSIYVIAAGNSYVDDISTCYPGLSGNYYGNANFSEINASPYTMVIGAVNANGVASSYSSPGANIFVSATGGEYGLSTEFAINAHYSEPALIAADFPGCTSGLKSFYTVYDDFDAGAAPNGNCLYTNSMNGTSAATPVASGAVALVLQANPNLSWRDVKYIMASTADKVDPTVNPATHPDSALDLAGHTYEQGWITNAAGFHFQNFYGFGRINVDAAVTMAKGFVSPLGPLTSTSFADDSGAIIVAIPDANAAGATRTLTSVSNLTLEAVQARVSISGCTGDMGIELTSPSGTKSILMNINSRIKDASISNHLFLSNAFYGENSNGVWTLKVIDGHATCTANLTNWKLNFVGY